jgi:hypothetical protein
VEQRRFWSGDRRPKVSKPVVGAGAIAAREKTRAPEGPLRGVTRLPAWAELSDLAFPLVDLAGKVCELPTGEARCATSEFRQAFAALMIPIVATKKPRNSPSLVRSKTSTLVYEARGGAAILRELGAIWRNRLSTKEPIP